MLCSDDASCSVMRSVSNALWYIAMIMLAQDKRELVNFRHCALTDIKGWTFEPDLQARKSCLELVIHPPLSNTVKHQI